MRCCRILIFIACMLQFVSCKNESPVSPNLPEFLFPLKVGNWEVLRTSTFDTTGTEWYPFNDSIYVFADTIIASDHWFLTTYGNYFAFTNKSDGVWGCKIDWNYFQGGYYFYPASLLFKYPANEGDQWEVHPDTSSWSLVSKSASIQVPHGLHTCYLYKLTEAFFDQRIDYYVEPGVGIVAEKHYSRTDSGREYLRQSSVLVSYRLL